MNNGSVAVDDEEVAEKKANMCEICLKNESKYKCPRCLMKTCSLNCCRQHKVNTGCSGEREKTRYVEKEEFGESLLLNDYRFLEEQSRLIDNLQRNIDQVAKPVADSAALKPIHSGVYEQLRKFVYRNFHIRLQLMPQQSTRHIFNRTRFNRHLGVVSWSLEFVFYLATKTNNREANFFRFNTKNFIFSSKLALKQALRNFYNRFKNELFNLEHRDLDKKFALVFENETFDGEVSILYEIVDMNKRKRYFRRLELEKTLEENLMNKTIIEYPTLFVVRNQNLTDFVVVESEEEDESNLNEEENGIKEDEQEDGEVEDDEPDEGEGKLIHEESAENRKRQKALDFEEAQKRLKFEVEPTRKRDENEELEEGEI